MKSDRARTFRPEACGKLLLLLTRLNGSSVFSGLPPFAATTAIEKTVGTSCRHGKRGVLRARELRRAPIRTKERLATTSISFPSRFVLSLISCPWIRRCESLHFRGARAAEQSSERNIDQSWRCNAFATYLRRIGDASENFSSG